MFRRTIFGQIIFFKNLLIKLVGLAAYPGLNWVNRLKVEGAEKLQKLPGQNVLFVSNHQTYFADVIAINYGIFSALAGRPGNTLFPNFLFTSKHNIYFVAAEETMKSGFLPKLFRYGGAITVKRTWREAGKEVKRELDPKDPGNMSLALSDGWVITFPQGTTSPFVEGRKGTAHLILHNHPVIIPVVIDGFRRAFNKTGLKFKKKKTTLRVKFKDALEYNDHTAPEELIELIMDAIEQSPKHLKVKELKP